MFNKKRFKELCVERDNTDWDYKINEIRKELLGLVTINESSFQEFLEYMKTEMTAEEYKNLSEISDEISDKKHSREFAEAYKFLASKYPKETQGHSMKSFIGVAEAWAEED